MADKAMKEIFNQCQNSMQSHGKLLKMLHKLYEKKEFEEFWQDFNHLMMYSLIIFRREPAVERTIDFVSKFVTYVTPSPVEAPSHDDSTIDEIAQNKLLQKMFDFLLKSHSAYDKAVRFRCCQMINKILGNLGEDAQIDDDLYDRIYESMLERLRDKLPVVRMHAVMALARLQDPRDENCPVIKAYLFLVSSDPNYEVRKIVLSHIAPSTKTLPAIIQRTRDVKDSVRKMAYTVMGEKVHIKALSIANRVRLLQDGLTDRSEIVKGACASKLLQTWLRTFGGNVLDLLGSLDVENSTETCELALETLFKAASIPEMVERFDLLDEKILIPLEKLNSESAMYWQTLCKYIYSLGHESEEYLDKVLPNCVEFCHYIQRYVESLAGLDDIDAQLEKEFVIQQLLTMTKYMELADQASRRAVEKLLHDMLIADHVGHSLVSHIVPRLCEIKDHSESMVVTLAETVSEIREPITTIERGPTQEEKRQNDLKIASIRVKINQLKEELDEAVKNQNFEKAAEIKASISECETERNSLLEIEPHVEEVKTEKTDVGTILKCQAIVAEMLEVLPLKTLNPTLQMLIESLILPGIQNEDSRVRNLAVQALGLCCVLSKDLVLQYLPLFMQASQIDAEIVRATALRVIFDMLHMHGLEAIHRGKDGEDEANTSGEGFDISRRSSVSDRQDDVRDGTASKLIVFLCGFLDGESSELRTVAAEGLAKLLLSGRVVSSKILSHLILLWYNPTTEDDTHLRHCLGTFFPVYAFAGRCNQEVVEDCFLSTLKTLLNAPTSSPLAEVNIENVAELLTQLTNAKLLMENQSNPEAVKDNPLHDSLAVKVCNEILSNPDSFNLKLWVKILKQIELSENNEVVFKELAVLADQLVEVVKEKNCKKTLEKFRDSVKEKVPEAVAEEEDQNQNAMETESVLPPTETEVAETTQIEEQSEADKTSEKTVLNDTALQLEGSLFLQEAKTLRRAQSKTGSGSSTPPRSARLPSERDVGSSPVSALFSTKGQDRRTEKPKSKWQDSILESIVDSTEEEVVEEETADCSTTVELSESPAKKKVRGGGKSPTTKEVSETAADKDKEMTESPEDEAAPSDKESEKTPKRKKRLDSDTPSEKQLKSPSKIPRLIRNTPTKRAVAESPAKAQRGSPRSKQVESPLTRKKQAASKEKENQSEASKDKFPKTAGQRKESPKKATKDQKDTIEATKAQESTPKIAKTKEGKEGTPKAAKTKESPSNPAKAKEVTTNVARTRRSVPNTPTNMQDRSKTASTRKASDVVGSAQGRKSESKTVSSPPKNSKGQIPSSKAAVDKRRAPVVRLTRLKGTPRSLASTRQSRSSASSQSPKRPLGRKSPTDPVTAAKKAKKTTAATGSQDSLTGSEDLFDSPQNVNETPRSLRAKRNINTSSAKTTTGKSKEVKGDAKGSPDKASPAGRKAASGSSQSEQEEEVSIRRKVKSATKSGRKSADTSINRTRLNLSKASSPQVHQSTQRAARGNKNADDSAVTTPSQSERRSLSRGKRGASDSQDTESPVRQTRGKTTSNSQEETSPSKRVRRGSDPKQRDQAAAAKKLDTQDQKGRSGRDIDSQETQSPRSTRGKRGLQSQDTGSCTEASQEKKNKKASAPSRGNTRKMTDKTERANVIPQTRRAKAGGSKTSTSDVASSPDASPVKSKAKNAGGTPPSARSRRWVGETPQTNENQGNRKGGSKTSESDVAESPIQAIVPRPSRQVKDSASKQKADKSTKGDSDGRRTSVRSSAKKAWAGEDSDLDNSVFSSPADRRASTRSLRKGEVSKVGDKPTPKPTPTQNVRSSRSVRGK